jgi:hypothetical protein
MAAFCEWPNAGLQTVECYSLLGYDEKVREIFTAIDTNLLDDDERDDYRRLEEYLAKSPAVAIDQVNRNRWLHILYFVLATVAFLFMLSLLLGH